MRRSAKGIWKMRRRELDADIVLAWVTLAEIAVGLLVLLT